MAQRLVLQVQHSEQPQRRNQRFQARVPKGGVTD